MSWFGNNELDRAERLIASATDEAAKNGDADLLKSLELSDLIRSKSLPAKEAMRALKSRLTTAKKPKILRATLQLVGTCVKNGGDHFIAEISSREFLDFVNLKLIKDDDASTMVRDKALNLIQSWAVAFAGKSEFKYFDKVYQSLKKQGYEFPEVVPEISQTLFDSNVPPEWEDSDACMICSNKFSMLNRKHHCRNCGGVYCGEHASHYIALLDLGITEPVRACDTCYDEVKHKRKSSKKNKNKDVVNARAAYDSDDDDDLRRAIELSLKESQGNAEVHQPQPVPSTANNEDQDEDEEFKAAIAASLKQFEEEKKRTQPYQQPHQSNDAYANLLPQSNSTYQPQQNYYERPPQQAPLASSQYINLTPEERKSITELNSKLIEAQNGPYNLKELTEAYNSIIPLKDSLDKGVNQSNLPYEQFTDLHSKVDNVMRIYNKILESEQYGQRQSQQYNGYQQPQQLPPQSEQYVPPQYYNPQNQQQFYQLPPQPVQYQQYQQPSQNTEYKSSANYSLPVFERPTFEQHNTTPLPQAPFYSNTSPIHHSVQPVQQTPTQTQYQASAPEIDYPSQPTYEQEQEEEYSAPPVFAYPPEPPQQQQQPQEPISQHTKQQSLNQTQPQLQGQQQNPPHQYEAPQHQAHQLQQGQTVPVQTEGFQSPPNSNNLPKVTDFNFPNVPAKKLDPVVQQYNPPEPVKPVEEELLIEL